LDSFNEAHRAQFLALLPGEQQNIIEKTLKLNSSNLKQGVNANIQSLFGDYQVIELPTVKFPLTDKWTLLEQLYFEKETTGVYLSGHPLDNFELEINSFANIHVREIPLVANKDLSVAVIITQVAHKMTKTGKPFGSVVIEDLESSFDFALFGEDYLKFKHFLVVGNMLLLKGKYQQRFNSNDQYEFKVHNMMLMQEVREKMTKMISFEVDINYVDEDFIVRFDNMLSEFPGKLNYSLKIIDHENELTIAFNDRNRKLDLNQNLLSSLHKIPSLEIRLT